MKHRVLKFLFIFVIVTINGCYSTNEPEETIWINDSYERKYYLYALKKEGVPYRESKDRGIWYPIKYREAERRAHAKLSSHYRAGCGFRFTSENKQDKLSAALEYQKIPYWLVRKDDGEWFVCQPEYTDAANDVFHEVLLRQ